MREHNEHESLLTEEEHSLGQHDLHRISRLSIDLGIEFPATWKPKAVNGLPFLDPNIVVFEDTQTNEIIIWDTRTQRKGLKEIKIDASVLEDYEGDTQELLANGDLHDVLDETVIPSEAVQKKKKFLCFGVDFGNTSWLTNFFVVLGVIVQAIQNALSILERHPSHEVVNTLNFVSNFLFLLSAAAEHLETINPGRGQDFGPNIRHALKNLCKRKAKRSIDLTEDCDPVIDDWKWSGFIRGSLACWASVCQMIGSVIFVLSSIDQILIQKTRSQVYNVLVNILNAFAWLFFALYGWFLTVEVQPSWWRMAPRSRVWRMQFCQYIGPLCFFVGNLFLCLRVKKVDHFSVDNWNLVWSALGALVYLLNLYLTFLEERYKNNELAHYDPKQQG
jgi:hypothetical protein